MTAQTGAAPPDIPGYELVRPLGAGGFADVFLYRQHLPEREVAIKVLRTPARTGAEQQRFESEANRMAKLSSHPFIVTIYEVGLAADNRPFLTMEFCPNDHFGRIVKAQPLSVSRALEIAIKVSAAVETAHQARILHRDIKPANVLLTAYDQPALTDFGIAGGLDGELTVEGMSVAFAAPEILALESVGDERSDVYGLAATTYALLARRSPFSQQGVKTDADLVRAALTGSLPPVGRQDVPPSLEAALRAGLARAPDDRFESAAAFGRRLQGIEAELGMPQTPLSIVGSGTSPSPGARSIDDTEEDRTRFRGIQRVVAQPPSPDPSTAASQAASDHLEGPTGTRGGGQGPFLDRDHLEDGTADRPGAPPRPRPSSSISDPADDQAPLPASTATSTNTKLLATAAAIVVLVAIIGFVALSTSGGDARAGDDRPSESTQPDPDAFSFAAAPEAPENVSVTIEGGDVVVAWDAPSAEVGDRYRVNVEDGDARFTEDTSITIEGTAEACVTVVAIRDDQASPASARVCTP